MVVLPVLLHVVQGAMREGGIGLGHETFAHPTPMLTQGLARGNSHRKLGPRDARASE